MTEPTSSPSTPPPATSIPQLPEQVDQQVLLRGWVDKKRSSGKIGFVQLRDSGVTVQLVVSRAEVDEESWEALQQMTQESTIEVVGTVESKVAARTAGMI